MATPVKNLAISEEEKKDCVVSNRKENEEVGVLEVFVHQARDIHNICIYHKQDVYARLSFTTDPENSVSTKTINGGGRNPVFNESVRLGVRSIDTSLKCEIWMLSRVKNYLEDQLLGFALIPLTDVVVVNGKLEKDFSLSSTDLFHSPAGFVQLSLSYNGAYPEVMAIPAVTRAGVEDSDSTKSHPSDLDMIEFPDPKIANEDQIMVSEYYGIPCSNLASESSGGSPEVEGEGKGESHVAESFSMMKEKSSEASKIDSPPSNNVGNDEVSSASLGASSESLEARVSSKCTTLEEEHVSAANGTSEKEEINGENGEVNDYSSSCEAASDTITKPVVVSVSIEPEDKVVQQDIVDMYMKSMQQFTESLAKMKLPLDIDTNGPPSSTSSTSDPNLQSPKNSGGSRVFYGSRAFF